MQKTLRVAIDTNFPLLLAKEVDDALDALNTVRERIHPAEIVIPPTALGELLYQSRFEPEQEQRQLAKSALNQLHSHWHFLALELDSMQEALAGEAARRTLELGLLPASERNDAAIIAESAVLNSILLVSNDSHLLQVDHRRLGLLFRELDLPVPLIVSPREIIQKFYR